MSGYDEEQARGRDEAPVSGFLQQPFSYDDLLAAIGRVLAVPDEAPA